MGMYYPMKVPMRPRASFCSVTKRRSTAAPAHRKADAKARRWCQRRYGAGATSYATVMRIAGLSLTCLAAMLNMMLHVALASKQYVSTPATDACTAAMVGGVLIYILALAIPSPRRRGPR